MSSVELARELLQQGRVFAVVGAHVAPERPAFYVPDYLRDQGYRVLPVNPRFAGQTMFGEVCVASLDDLQTTPDMVIFFRRSDAIGEYEDAVLRLHPHAAWMQLGIANEGVAARWREAGIRVIQNRCTLADHRAFGLPPRRPET